MSNILDFGKNYDNLMAFHVPDVSHTPEFQKSIDNDYMYKRSLFRNHPHRCFIYFGNNRLHALEKIKHSQEVIELLNKDGINIYLFEPLCFKENKTDEYTDYFYSEINFDTNKQLYCDELESILVYQKNNNLTNINVHTCDYNVEKYFNHYSSNSIKLLCNDLFLTHFGFQTSYELPNDLNFTHKFLCTNWRYTKVRNLISAYLIEKDSYISWYFKAPFEKLKENISWIDLNNWKSQFNEKYNILESGTVILNEKIPLNIDKNILIDADRDVFENGNPYPAEIQDKVLNFAITNTTEKTIESFYKNFFCEVVTESRFAQPTGNISEKTIRAIYYQKPFILVAPPNSLEHLVKNYGFKTFSEFWDESYDLETNHERRLLKIFDVIDEINGYSTEKMHDIYRKMKPIFDHNTHLLYAHNFIKTDRYNKIMFS